MEISTETFRTIGELKDFIRKGTPTFYHGSRTSTVIPYEKMSEYGDKHGWKSFSFGNLSNLTPELSLDSSNNLVIQGPVTWQEARLFCRSKGRNTMTAPTEELACILSGVATSCTGERCFGYGTLREQIIRLNYLNDRGEAIELSSDKLLIDHDIFQDEKARDLLLRYQAEYESYKDFKNAPFPRMEVESDLMIGTEGQLGLVIEGVFKTVPLENVTYIFMALPKWEEDYSIHLDLFERVQNYRDKVYSCELIDENSWSYLSSDKIPMLGKDIVFLEVETEHFESVYEDVVSKVKGLDPDLIFEIPESKCRSLRMEIPRAIFEVNTKMGVTKKGTDVQVRAEDFGGLLEKYREMSKLGVPYNLFGHFGDAHLHFNFMPKANEEEKCQQSLEELYKWVKDKKGSPFAEHGIGLLKQYFIKPFYDQSQYNVFSFLKGKMDPKGIFFPEGFLNMREGSID